MFSIRDLSDENENRKNGVIGNIIASEQRKNYIPNKSFPFMVNMIKKSEDDYLCMITIYEQMECSKKKADIFYRLFHTREIRKLFYMQKQEKEGLFRSTEYWRNIFAKEIEQSGLGDRKNRHKEIRRGKKTRRKEVYLLDREASNLMEDIGQEHHVSIKSIFLAVWGVMLCKFFGQKEIVMGDLNRIGKMELIPIRVERSDNFKDMFLNIQKQITDAKEYDNYTLQELEVSLGYSLKEDMRVVHNFFDMPIIKDTFQSMAAFTVYHMEMPEAMQAAPLEVSYNLLSEIKRIQYCYETDAFENVEIQQIHDNFAQLLKGILLAMKKQTDYKEDISDVVTAKKSNKELVQIAQIAYYLRQSKILSTLVMEELLSLAKKCHLIKGVSEEVIIQDQSNVNSLYIIGEGKVVQNGVDRDSFVHTLQVLKEGDLFGVECICKNSVSEHSYVIYSDCAFVVEIPSEVIWQEMQKKPYLIREFLDWENSQIAKYQSLWIME